MDLNTIENEYYNGNGGGINIKSIIGDINVDGNIGGSINVGDGVNANINIHGHTGEYKGVGGGINVIDGGVGGDISINGNSGSINVVDNIYSFNE